MSISNKTKLMILCWGYSIHAERRAQLFVEDPRFEVTIVSTYDYFLPGSRTVLLGSGKKVLDSDPSVKNNIIQHAKTLPLFLRNFIKIILKIIGLILEIPNSQKDFKSLLAEIKKSEPHVILLQTFHYPSYLAFKLPKQIPLIVTFWNGDLTHFAKYSGLEILMKKRLVISGLKRVQAITVNSQTAYDAGIALGADHNKMKLVRYPAADLKKFYPIDKMYARKKLNIAPRHVLLCPRGMGKFFNSEVIVQAAAYVAEQFPDLLILFISKVGGTEEWKRHIKIAKRLGISEKMRWDGHIAWEDMPLYYSAANAMISIQTEDSCPNCMLESMACGTPVIMSDTKQNREWIKDEENGFLCPPKDSIVLSKKIIKILANKENITSKFASISLQKVRKDANSETNKAVIKNLVINLGHKRINNKIS